MRDCSNISDPARTKHAKPGRPYDRDRHCKIHSTKRRQAPSVRCKVNPSAKLNNSILQEVEHLMEQSGIWTPDESTGCCKETCENHVHPVSRHPNE